MKKFSFSLERLLSVRNREEQLAKKLLAATYSIVMQLKRKIDEDHSYCNHLLDTTNFVDISAYMAIKQRVAYIENVIAENNRRLIKAKKQLDILVQKYRQAEQRSTILNKLKEKAWERYRIDKMRQEEYEISEQYRETPK